MFSSPMNTRRTPARAHFSMKFGSLWQSVSTWMMKPILSFSTCAQVDQAIEDRLPVLVAGEIVVGDEEAAQPLRVVDPHDLLDVVGRAAARHAALHIDDGAERALIGTAAAGIETGDAADGALRALQRHQRNRRALDVRQVVHEIVERLQRAGGRIAQHLLEPAFGLAGEQRQAHGLGAVEIGIDAVQHRQSCRTRGSRRSPTAMPRSRSGRAISSARGNWFDCTPTSITMPAPAASISRAIRSGRMRVLVSSKAWMSMVDVVTEDAALGAVLGESEERRQRVGRDRRAKPLNDVSVFIVMRRLDENETESPARRAAERVRLGHEAAIRKRSAIDPARILPHPILQGHRR